MLFLDVFFDCLILVFFVRLFAVAEEDFYFNPFVSGPIRFADAAVERIGVPLGLSEKAATVFLLFLALLAKLLLFAKTGAALPVTIGGTYVFRQVPSPSHLQAFSFVALRTGIFFVRVWSLWLLLDLIQPRLPLSRPMDALSYFSKPVSALRKWKAALATFALSCVLLALLVRLCSTSEASALFTGVPVFCQFVRTIYLGCLSMVDSLYFLNQTLFALVIANLLFALLGMFNALQICNEAIDGVMGRFGRIRLNYNTWFDFRTIFFFLVVNILYATLATGFAGLINSPVWNGGFFL